MISNPFHLHSMMGLESTRTSRVFFSLNLKILKSSQFFREESGVGVGGWALVNVKWNKPGLFNKKHKILD